MGDNFSSALKDSVVESFNDNDFTLVRQAQGMFEHREAIMRHQSVEPRRKSNDLL